MRNICHLTINRINCLISADKVGRSYLVRASELRLELSFEATWLNFVAEEARPIEN